MDTRTYTLTFNGITLDTSKLRMNKRGGAEVINYFFLNKEYQIEDETIVDVQSFRKAIKEGGDECKIISIDGDKTTVSVMLELDPIRKPEPATLACMSTHLDGAHRGLGDWYSEIERGIADALSKGVGHQWTTGWYASKHEIASAKITCDGHRLLVEVSVSDDFDTPGLGERRIEHTEDLETIREAISEAWDEAGENQKDNRVYCGFSVLTEVESHALYIAGKPQGEPVKHQGWVETYIRCDDPYGWDDDDSPPGDNYHKWGFQEEFDMPEDVKLQLQKWAENWGREHEEEQFTCGDFTIKPWDG